MSGPERGLTPRRTFLAGLVGAGAAAAASLVPGVAAGATPRYLARGRVRLPVVDAEHPWTITVSPGVPLNKRPIIVLTPLHIGDDFNPPPTVACRVDAPGDRFTIIAERSRLTEGATLEVIWAVLAP